MIWKHIKQKKEQDRFLVTDTKNLKQGEFVLTVSTNLGTKQLLLAAGLMFIRKAILSESNKKGHKIYFDGTTSFVTFSQYCSEYFIFWFNPTIKPRQCTC